MNLENMIHGLSLKQSSKDKWKKLDQRHSTDLEATFLETTKVMSRSKWPPQLLNLKLPQENMQFNSICQLNGPLIPSPSPMMRELYWKPCQKETYLLSHTMDHGNRTNMKRKSNYYKMRQNNTLFKLTKTLNQSGQDITLQWPQFPSEPTKLCMRSSFDLKIF